MKVVRRMDSEFILKVGLALSAHMLVNWVRDVRG